MSCCKGSIGDWFVSDLKRQEKESDLLDAELAREQKEQLLNYMGGRKAMASGDTSGDNKKYMVLGGLAVILLAVIILKG